MRRRDLLRAAGAVGATALAGCTFGQSGLVDTRIDLDFEPRRQRRPRPIVVSWDDDAGAVFVQGFMYYGSSSCNRIGVTEVRYDAEADTLYTTLNSVEKGWFPNLGCTADMAASHYQVRFRFADSLPETVVVREDGSGANDERTVVRSEQERLCTTDHPEGSEAAAKAHWTCPEKYLRASVSVDSEE
ncbi:twin-arginine translocation signal domain-containing protein [Halorarius litoreus]|uniref:twin-arginine translocation signal domain-containing protein n=1 Tax=Halorarius litoreus TaxID=2962676 RepID=UPI0020CF1562|nr:twin-arginine translocation signal domain-containing protein [Halorarius litoreus]